MRRERTRTAPCATLLALALCAFASAAAAADEPSEPATRPDPPALGIVIRGGWFGLPDPIADQLFDTHPKVDGWFTGVEIRYHGEGGLRGVASFGLTVDHGSTEAEGEWRTHAEDPPAFGAGSIDFTSVTLTGYWNIFPTAFLHPYVGLGVGTGYFKGSYIEDGERVTVDTWLPVVTLPLGLAFEFGERVHVALEGRFINGVSAGAVLQALF